MARRVAMTAPSGAAGGLACVLADWPDARLAELLRARPDLGYPEPRSLADLARRAELRPSVAQAVRGLDLGARAVLEATCLVGPSAAVAELAELLGHPPDAGLRAALERLADRALVTLLGESVSPVGGVHEALVCPGGLGPPAETLLRAAELPALQRMAERLGLERPARKQDALKALAAALSDAATVRAAVEAGPQGTADLARRLAGGHPLAPYESSYYGDRFSPDAARQRSPFGWLASRGLLLPLNWYQAAMPAETCLALRGGRVFPGFRLLPPEVGAVPVAPDVDRVAAEAAERLVSDAGAILDALGAAPAKLLKNGGVGVREVRRAAKLTGREEGEAARILELLGASGLLGCGGRDGLAAPTVDHDAWRSAGTAERWARLVSGWLAWPRELWAAGAEGDNGKPVPPLLPGPWDPDSTGRRRAILSVMAGPSPGLAVPHDDLVERLTWEAPAAWSPSPGVAPWLVARLSEELSLLGLSAAGALSAAGRAVAGGSVDEAARALAGTSPDVVDHLHLQADLTGVVPGRLAPPVEAELELMADVESRGHATVYRFSEASLRRALEAGRTAQDLLGVLEAHGSRGVPQPLRYLVTDTARRFGRVRVGAAGAYLVCADEALAAEVLAERGLARLRLRRLAPTVLVCPAPPADALAALARAGYLPAHEGADGQLVVSRPAEARAPALIPPAVRAAARLAEPEAVVAALRRAPAPAAPPAPRRARVAAPRSRGIPPGAPRLFAVPPGWSEEDLQDIDPGEMDELLAGLLYDDDLDEEDLDDDEGAPRPRHIARGREAVRDLLVRSVEEEWMVRLSYLNGKGKSSAHVVVVLDMDQERARVAGPPHYDERLLWLARIEWARVLTEAEEEALS